MLTRRNFIQKSVAAGAAIMAAPHFISAATSAKNIVHTVSGPIAPSAMGFTLTHEHVLADFIGAEKYSRDRYDANDVFKVALPHLKALKATGCKTFIDCSPAYLGRDVLLLKRLADATGLQIITNTGYYGAVEERFLPKHVYDESAEQLSARWTLEFKEGIEGTGIKPGFIKTSTDKGPLTPTQRKIVRAAALTHLATGLTMLVHTGDGAAANEQLAILKEAGVDYSARVWTHAQNESDTQYFINAARENCWVSFDGVNPETIETNIGYLKLMKANQLLDHVLVSQDSGWYNVGEVSGGNYKSYTCIDSQFIPALLANGFKPAEIDLIFKTNPSKAFTIAVRKV